MGDDPASGLDRDIVFNLCQYGMGDVWKWGGEVGGHCWRTTGDLGLAKDTRLPGFYSIAFKNMAHSEYAEPGNWNDPDYILIGYIGNARRQRRSAETRRPHRRRAVQLHVALGADGLAAVLHRRHGPPRRVHPQRALQCRSHRHRPGRARQTGARGAQDRRRTGHAQAARGRVGRARPVQPCRRAAGRFRPSGPSWASVANSACATCGGSAMPAPPRASTRRSSRGTASCW